MNWYLMMDDVELSGGAQIIRTNAKILLYLQKASVFLDQRRNKLSHYALLISAIVSE